MTERKSVYYAVGREYHDDQIKVMVTTSSNTLFMGTELAKEFALDILIQIDRIEKIKVWKSLKNEELKNNA